MSTPMTTPARPVRALTMKATPIDAAVAHSGVTASINAFALAEPNLGGLPMWFTTSTAASDYCDALDALVLAVQRAKQDRDRTPEAQWRAIDALVGAWRTSADERIARAEAQVGRWSPAEPSTAKIVSERLGHATTKLTLDIYSHVTPTMQDEATVAIAGLVYAPADAARPVN